MPSAPDEEIAFLESLFYKKCVSLKGAAELFTVLHHQINTATSLDFRQRVNLYPNSA